MASSTSVTDLKGKQRQPPVVQPASGNSIVINPCQRLNPVVECVRNVPKEFGDILPDYQVGRTTGVIFLSLRYHRLHPEYIHQRIERLGQSYNLRILLLMCDISEHQDPIRELTRICLLNNITVIVAWSADEAGQYLTAYKQSEHRPPTLIRERIDKTPDALLRTALTSIPRVNKTDAETLRSSFGSFARIAQADAAQIARLPGFGPKKVSRLKDAFERPFRTSTTSALATTVPAPTTSSSSSSSSSSSLPAAAAAADADSERGSHIPIPGPSRRNQPPRQQQQQQGALSPAWDIELDLNSPSPEPAAVRPSKRVRGESSPWDVESISGDDDDSGWAVGLDDDAGAADADMNMNVDMGTGKGMDVDADADVDADVDMESDTDLAPALRAKRCRS